jgi:hypothetical protein
MAAGSEASLYVIRRYRPCIEGELARIERISHPTLGVWWRVTSRDNATTFFRIDDATRIVDPAAPDHVFQWLPAVSFDDQGNCLAFEYKPEDLAAVPFTRSEGSRRSGVAVR